MGMWPGSRKLLLVSLGFLFAIACVISTTTLPFELDKNSSSVRAVKTPLKAHLRDGSVIVFPTGAMVGNGSVAGDGRRFSVARTDSHAVNRVALDSVLGLEVYERRVNPGRTLIYGALSFVGLTVATAAVALAVFGSCPTVYGDSAGVPVLQAESFSYSIAPLLAKRDVDRLHVSADSGGAVRLIVRNEALETHHIDHLELLELRHHQWELALPAPKGDPIAVSDIVRPASIRDGAGRDVDAVLAKVDAAIFSSDSALLDRAIAGGSVQDHLDITLPKRPGRDSLALVLQARSSLLTTAVLYDYMLGRPGASSLDWMGQDLARITTLAQVAKWYLANFGMRVEVFDDKRWRSVGRLMDFGPTAWRNVGVIVPALGKDSVRIRISFTADAFRINRVAVAWGVRRLTPRTITLARAYDAHGQARPDVVRMLANADDREVETHPGDRFDVEFDAGKALPGTRTFLLAAQGYYREWVRAAWMQAATDSVPFSVRRAPIREVLRSWRASKDTLERKFFVQRVPAL